MVDLPSQVTYGRVKGQIIKGVKDSNDAGSVPDLEYATGTFKFAPELIGSLQLDALPGVLISPQAVEVRLDETGSYDVFLIATDFGDNVIKPWTWRVTPNVPGVKGLSPISISVPTNSIQSITDWMPVAQSVGALTMRGPTGPQGETGPAGQDGVSPTDPDKNVFVAGSEWRMLGTPGDPNTGVLNGYVDGSDVVFEDATAEGDTRLRWDLPVEFSKPPTVNGQEVVRDTGLRQIHLTNLPRYVGQPTADFYFTVSRTGNHVQFYGNGGDLLMVNAIPNLVPEGFRPFPGGYLNVTYLNTNVDPPTIKSVQFNPSGDLFFVGESGVASSASKLMQNLDSLLTTWRTEDPWPETLPGDVPS